MSNITSTPTEIRKQLRTISADEFIKAHTAQALAEVAGIMGTEIPEDAKTKQQVYDAIVKGANLPNPALRGKSKVDSPVAKVWSLSDVMVAGAKEGERAKRSEVVAEAQKQGIAYYTARTQYQAWFSATDKGTKRLSDLTLQELPKDLHPVEEAVSTDG